MDIHFSLGMNEFLCAGYYLSMVCINFIMFLFSSFYRKKFNQPSPRWGFIIATGSALLCIFILFFRVSPYSPEWGYFRIFRSLCLAGSAITSGWSSAYLFYTMKRTRK